MSALSASAFAVAVGFEQTQVVLRVRGEVDLVTAPELGAVIAAVIDRGHRVVVVDLAETTFMDAAGLGVLARAAHRLGGGAVTIRSPSATVRRILDITGLSDAFGLDQPAADPAHLGPEQTVAVPGSPVTSPAVGLAQQLRRVAAAPADGDVVDATLRLVVALARATVGGADGVSVSLRRHGRLATVAASDHTISDMDADQYTTGEGPCVDASVLGRWFHVEALAAETRWPAFTPRARALGINAILSCPLLVRDEPVGALNIYSSHTAAFAPKDQELAALFASQASTILAEAGIDVTDDQLAARLAEALQTRQLIAQAQGVVMALEGIDSDAAYATMRRYSAETGTPLWQRAKTIVSTAGRPPRVSQAAPDV